MRSRSLLLVILLSPLTAHAAGSYVGDIEAAAMGQGGAFIASPNTLGAFWYNPAALAGQQGLRLQVEGGLQITPLTFQRDANPLTGQSYTLVQNSLPYKPAFFAAVSYDFGIKDLAVGLSVTSPTAGSYVYTEGGTQRYSSIGAYNTLFNIHLGVAYRPFSWLSLGLTFGNTYFTTKQQVAISGAISGDPEADAFAVPFEINVTDPFTITSNFGVRIEPIKQLSIGVSIAPPFDLQASGTGSAKLPPLLANLASISGDKVDLALRMPMVLRAGVRYRFIERLSAEAAFVWQQWSRNDVITLTPQDMRISAPALMVDNVPIPQIGLQKNYRDSYAARLGIEALPIDLITLRAGAFYETSATRPERFDISTPDTNKFGLSVGASLNVWKFSIDAAYVAIIAPAVTVNNSQLIATAVVPGAMTTPSTLGNGRYEFGFHMIHLGVRASFFDAPKAAPPAEPSSTDALAPSADAPSTSPSP